MFHEMSNRPRPDSIVQVDLSNAYARAGVSPLADTRQIKQAIIDKVRTLKAQLRTKSDAAFGGLEQEIAELQKIEEVIGAPKARARYDQQHPENELLMVQPAADDDLADPQRRAALVTAWLVEQLGRQALLPSAECLAFWNIDSQTGAALGLTTDEAAPSAVAIPPVAAPTVAAETTNDLPELALLESLLERADEYERRPNAGASGPADRLST